jgi:hypothetical protein
MFLRSIIYSLLFLTVPFVLSAQGESSSASLSAYHAAFDSAVSKINHNQLAVYTGREYYDYYLKKESKHGGYWLSGTGNRPGEHPFFLGGEFRREMIVYNDVTYSSIDLAYDICRSEVVVLNLQHIPIVLPEGKVQKFNYAGHAFRALTDVSGLRNDFYDILYWSDSTVLCVKRRKNQTELWHSFSDYYIILNNEAYPVSLVGTKNVGVKSAALKILKDKEDEVRSYIRQNKLKFSKSKKESSLVKVVAYYASLKTN